MNVLHLSVKGRIYSGFGVLVVLSLALAGFAGWQLSSIGTQVGKLSGIADNTTRALKVGQDLEVMRRSIHSYMLDFDDARLKDGNDAAPEAVKMLQDSAKVTPSAERKRAYQNVESEVNTYQGMVRNLAAAGGDLKKDKDTLFKVGDDVTAATDKLVRAARATGDAHIAEAAAAVETQVLLVRVANWRFQATNDPKGPATFKTNSDKANAAIAALEKNTLPDDLRALIAPVKSALAAYAKAFEGLSGNALKIADVFAKDMVPLIHKMGDELKIVEAALNQGFEATKTESEDTVAGTVTLQKIIGGLALLLGCAIAYFVGRGIVKPITGMTQAMQRLAAGDTGAEIPSRDAKDEIGAMAQSVEVFRQNAIERGRLEADTKEGEARTAAKRKAELHELAQRFEGAVGGIVENISSSATELEAAAETLTKTAETTQQLSGAVASASEQASSNVNSVASSTDEMASSVSEISRQVQESSNIAREAVTQAQRTDARIGELSQAASRIGDVVKLITAIAEQTNLLALNATIEAARAGEAGRGFAVVAQEVKALAAQTAKATDEIGSQISAMQTVTKDSVAAIKEISATIDRVSEIAGTIAAAVEEQGAATHEIARNVQQAAHGTAQVAGNIADVNRGASETGSASAQVLSSAQQLAGEGNRLRLEVDKFLATVRAA